MKEREFNYYLLKHYSIKYININMFYYFIEIPDELIDIYISYNECKGKILPLINIKDKINVKEYYYQSFRKALNRIETITKNEGESNDKN